jgi:AcrR family transcriptional regulator
MIDSLATTSVDRPRTRPCGPRAEAREQAILEAALELLVEVGYDRLSMDALAERARAGKATIYRHWSGKAPLVVDAIRHMKCERLVPATDTGSLRGDLVEAVVAHATVFSEQDAALMAGVMSAMRTDPELAELVRTQLAHDPGWIREIADRAVHRGELPEGSSVETAAEVLGALMFQRLVINGQPVDEAFAVHAVDDVVLPLLHR